jgi:hypothetical protein
MNETRGFIKWCDEDADLVYKGDVIHADGRISFAGSTKPGNTKNYEYSLNLGDEYKDFEYRK